MAISETVLILAGGTAVLSILFGIRLARRADAGGATVAPRSDGGEAAAGGSGGLLIDAIFGPIYYRMLLRLGPLTEQYGNGLISQAVRGTQPGSTNKRS